MVVFNGGGGDRACAAARSRREAAVRIASPPETRSSISDVQSYHGNVIIVGSSNADLSGRFEFYNLQRAGAGQASRRF